MAEYELRVGDSAELAQAASRVESCCANAGLRVTLKDTLQAYPGCVHWHYKYGNQPGTLEITLWPMQRRLWVKVASNRCGPWIAEAVERVRPCIEDALR